MPFPHLWERTTGRDWYARPLDPVSRDIGGGSHWQMGHPFQWLPLIAASRAFAETLGGIAPQKGCSAPLCHLPVTWLDDGGCCGVGPRGEQRSHPDDARSELARPVDWGGGCASRSETDGASWGVAAARVSGGGSPSAADVVARPLREARAPPSRARRRLLLALAPEAELGALEAVHRKGLRGRTEPQDRRPEPRARRPPPDAPAWGLWLQGPRRAAPEAPGARGRAGARRSRGRVARRASASEMAGAGRGRRILAPRAPQRRACAATRCPGGGGATVVAARFWAFAVVKAVRMYHKNSTLR